ncbi:hypothetical protein [uncultured Desulfosarcina sp.]|uniref:hypothetical protein n=1 Tax=uncultured Desulfosarcina sp. TaxID=218289 RepID=UPI0029C6DECB|nr:hypothetical protein [uncultured Desulfosarcina sp.]
MKVKFILRPIYQLFVLIAFCLAASASADGPLVQQSGSGCIDWSAGTVRAKGVGTPAQTGDNDTPAEASAILENARQTARKKLLETVMTIRIDAGSRIADRVQGSPDFLEGLHTLAGNAAVTRQEYLSDGTLEIELTMNLTGGFGQFVLPEEIRQVEPVTTMNTAQKETQSTSKEKVGVGSAPYTGLIVDAVGIGAKPALVPVIADESGEVVYGPAFASREFAVSRGMSGYAASLDAARKDPRVGDRPLIVKAIRTRFTGNTDLVIPTTEAARLRSSAIHLNFLKACRVCIVLDGMVKQ